jgi:alpha-D-ribose 1-methylphosphonate 5-triphosphate synthase subunit PhnH
MAHPGKVGEVTLHEHCGRFGAAISLLASVLDHEVTFAVIPSEESVTETVLRYTGSRSADLDQADYLLGFDNGRSLALQAAKLGSFEYPDQNGTVLLQVDNISTVRGPGLELTLAGPGIRDTVSLWVSGLTAAEVGILTKRNSAVPLGIDAVLVTPRGQIACVPRYTRLETIGV